MKYALTGTGNRLVPANHIDVKDMKGNTINNFINDLLTMGGMKKLYLDEYDNCDPQNKKLLKTHTFWGNTFAECVEQFEAAKIFDGMTIYEAEREIEVLYG